MAAEQTGLFKWHNPLCGDRSKRNQNKYCQYHKDVGHTTEECITLKDEIKKLIYHGYLKDYINGRRARPQNDAPETSLHTKSEQSSSDLILPEKCVGHKNGTSGRRSRGHSLMFTVWIGGLRNNTKRRMMTSPSKKAM